MVWPIRATSGRMSKKTASNAPRVPTLALLNSPAAPVRRSRNESIVLAMRTSQVSGHRPGPGPGAYGNRLEMDCKTAGSRRPRRSDLAALHPLEGSLGNPVEVHVLILHIGHPRVVRGDDLRR